MLRLREHLDVAASVVLAVMRDARLREQPLHQRETLVQHIAAARVFLQARRPSSEFLAVGADTDAENEPAVRHLVDRRRLLGEPERIAHRQDCDRGADLQSRGRRGTERQYGEKLIKLGGRPGNNSRT